MYLVAQGENLRVLEKTSMPLFLPSSNLPQILLLHFQNTSRIWPPLTTSTSGQSHHHFFPEQLQHHLIGTCVPLYSCTICSLPRNQSSLRKKKVRCCSQAQNSPVDSPSHLERNLNCPHFLTKPSVAVLVHLSPHPRPLSPCPLYSSHHVCLHLFSFTSLCFGAFILAAPSCWNVLPSPLHMPLPHSFANLLILRVMLLLREAFLVHFS